jgi:hypothetical protein
MSSKQLAKILVTNFAKSKYSHDLDRYVFTRADMEKLEENVELFLLRKFEEGRHVGRDHDSLVETADGEFKYEKK